MTHPRTQADSPTKTPARSLRKGDSLPEQLEFLKLPFMREHYENLAKQAAANHWTHLDYLARLIEGEAAWHEDRSIGRRVKLARFPVLKTLEQFQWSWPRNLPLRSRNGEIAFEHCAGAQRVPARLLGAL
jgi:hypothetical protein